MLFIWLVVVVMVVIVHTKLKTGANIAQTHLPGGRGGGWGHLGGKLKASSVFTNPKNIRVEV